MWTLIVLSGVLVFAIWMMIKASELADVELNELDGPTPPDPRVEELRGAYEQGCLHGHLMTVGKSFARNDLPAISQEWITRQRIAGNL